MKPLTALALLLSAAACGGTPVRSDRPGPAKIAKHETFLRNPTTIRGEEARAILPRSYGDALEVRGLSAGWREAGGKRTWEGTGSCRLELLSLVIEASALTVTLVPDGGDPEVILQATGGVSYRHTVRGRTQAKEGLQLLMITNDRLLER